MVGQVLAGPYHTGGEVLVPPSEGGHDEVVQTAHDAGYEQRFGLAAALGAAHQHLRGGSGLGEGVLAVHVAHKVFAEGDKEKNAQYAAQQRTDEHFGERYGHVGIFSLQDVDGGQREDGTGHDDARTGAYRLDDDVLAQRVLALGGGAHTHGDDGDGDGGLEHLAHFQTQVGSGGRENHGHDDTPGDRPAVHFRIDFVWRKDGFVLLAFFQFPKRVLGQLQHVFFFVVHNFLSFIISCFSFFSSSPSASTATATRRRGGGGSDSRGRAHDGRPHAQTRCACRPCPGWAL